MIRSSSATAAPDGAATDSSVPAPLKRRQFLTALLSTTGALATGLVAAPLAARRLHAEPARRGAAASPVALVVYKDPGCGCCKEWVRHMQKAGFVVTAHDTTDMDSVKRSLGVPAKLASCHTAVVGTYLIEGHVPADLVQRLVSEKPAARGLAVPGMPNGSPGMEGPVKDKYDVLLFERTGSTRVYASR